MKLPTIRLLYALLFALPLAGCARSPSVRFYTLTPLTISQAPPTPANALSVRVLPIRLPDYLNRPQIVIREGDNSVKLAEYHRWAGRLEENMTAVVAQNLGLLLGTDRVFDKPGVSAEKATYSVAIEVLQLESLKGRQVMLKARWGVSPYRGSDRGMIRLSTYSQRVADASYDAIVAAISRTVESLCREIATEVMNSERTRSP